MFFSLIELSLENKTIHIKINLIDSDIPITSFYLLSGGQKIAFEIL
jgi:hypothetical protein